MCVYLCGGSCIEDVTTHLMKHLSLHPTEINGIEFELNSILVEKWKGKPYRLVIQRQRRQVYQRWYDRANLQYHAMPFLVYAAILLSHLDTYGNSGDRGNLSVTAHQASGYQFRYVHYRYWWHACLTNSIPACRLHGRESFQCPTGSSRIWTWCSTHHHQEQKDSCRKRLHWEIGRWFQDGWPCFRTMVQTGILQYLASIRYRKNNVNRLILHHAAKAWWGISIF